MILLSAALALGASLTYEEALQRAAERAPGVASARGDRQAAEGALLSARAPFEPTFSLSGSTFSSTNEGQFQFGEYTSETTGLNSSASLSQALATGTSASIEFSANQSDTSFRVADLEGEFGEPAWDSKLALSLSQSLLQGHRMAYNLAGIHAATSSLTAADLSLELARQEAIASAARAYWQLSTARRLVDIAEQSVLASAEQARITRALVDAGRLARVELTRIDAARAQAERAELEARAGADAANDTLAALLGLPPAERIDLATAPTPPPDVTYDEAGILDAVKLSNPQLRLASATLADRKRQLADARHALLPELGATGSLSLRGYDPTFGGSIDELGTARLPEWSLGAQLSLPLLNRADRGAAAQAEGALARAQADYAAAESQVLQSARAQLRVLATAAKSLELTQLNVRLAEETLSAEMARLKEGKSLQKDVITAQKDLDQARADAETARTDWLVAVVELERLKGAL